MLSRNHNGVHFASGLALLILSSLSVSGCSRNQSASEALQKSLEINNMPQLTVVKCSGTVTIDGLPPVVDRLNPLLVMAYDPKHPPKGRQVPFTATCDKNGHFEFSTYGKGDGLPAGSYVALFAEPKMGSGDGLKNLYNDPDKNANEERFQFNLTPQGKTDWTFDLAVAGKEPVTAPGPNAVRADRGRK